MNHDRCMEITLYIYTYILLIISYFSLVSIHEEHGTVREDAVVRGIFSFVNDLDPKIVNISASLDQYTMVRRVIIDDA